MSNKNLEAVQEDIVKTERKFKSDLAALNKRLDNICKNAEKKIREASSLKTDNDKDSMIFRVESEHLQEVFREVYINEMYHDSDTVVPEEETLQNIIFKYAIGSNALIIPPRKESRDYSSWTKAQFDREVTHLKSYWRKKLFSFLYNNGGLKDVPLEIRNKIFNFIYKNLSWSTQVCVKHFSPPWDSDGKYDASKASVRNKFSNPVESLREIGKSLLAYCLMFYFRVVFIPEQEFHDILLKPFLQPAYGNIPKLLFHHVVDDINPEPHCNSLPTLKQSVESRSKKGVDLDHFYQAFMKKRFKSDPVDYEPKEMESDDPQYEILANRRFPFNKYTYGQLRDFTLFKTPDPYLKFTANFNMTIQFFGGSFEPSYLDQSDQEVIDWKKRHVIDVRGSLLDRTKGLVGTEIIRAELRLYLTKASKKRPQRELVESRFHLFTLEEICTNEEPAVYLSNYKTKIKTILIKTLEDIDIYTIALKKFDVELRDAKFSTLQGERHYISRRYQHHIEKKRQKKFQKN